MSDEFLEMFLRLCNLISVVRESQKVKKQKQKHCIHTVLPATRHKWTRPALTPASKLVLNLPTPEGWKAELT